METTFKNGDKVIWTDGQEYVFIGVSSSETNYINKLDCVIERNDCITYAISADLKLKPETVIHQGGEIPRPLSEHDAIGVLCWFPSAGQKCNVGQVLFSKDNEYIYRLCNMGLLHATKEAAIDHAKVIYQIEDEG